MKLAQVRTCVPAGCEGTHSHSLAHPFYCSPRYLPTLRQAVAQTPGTQRRQRSEDCFHRHHRDQAVAGRHCGGRADVRIRRGPIEEDAGRHRLRSRHGHRRSELHGLAVPRLGPENSGKRDERRQGYGSGRSTAQQDIQDMNRPLETMWRRAAALLRRLDFGWRGFLSDALAPRRHCALHRWCHRRPKSNEVRC